MAIEVRSALTPGGACETWLNYCAPFEYPESYGLFSLLTVASCAINGRIVVNPGYVPSPLTNIYVLLYGPSGARKGEAMQHAMYLLGEACPSAPTLPGNFTKEKLVSMLAKESSERGKCSGLILKEEFSDLVGGPDYTLQNSQLLTELWDGRPQMDRATIARDEEQIQFPYITGLWSTSPEWAEEIDSRRLAGGFLRRVLIVVEYGPRQESSRPSLGGPLFDRVRTLFRERLDPLSFGESYMHLSPDAIAEMDFWYKGFVSKLKKSADEKAGHFASCAQSHALKLAAIVNVLEGRGSEVLEAESFLTGAKLVEAVVPAMFHTYASLVPTPYAKLRAKIIRSVQSHGLAGIQDAALTRAIVITAGVPPDTVEKTKGQMLADGTLARDTKGRLIIGG